MVPNTSIFSVVISSISSVSASYKSDAFIVPKSKSVVPFSPNPNVNLDKLKLVAHPLISHHIHPLISHPC